MCVSLSMCDTDLISKPSENLSKNRKAPTWHIMNICRNANMGTPWWWSVPVWLFILKCITAFEMISFCIKDPGLLENVALGLLIVILKTLYVFLHYKLWPVWQHYTRHRCSPVFVFILTRIAQSIVAFWPYSIFTVFVFIFCCIHNVKIVESHSKHYQTFR